MNDETLLRLFGGNVESLEHYKLLRRMYTEKRCNIENVCEDDDDDFVSSELNGPCEEDDDAFSSGSPLKHDGFRVGQLKEIMDSSQNSSMEDSNSPLRDVSPNSSLDFSHNSSKDILHKSSCVHSAVLRPMEDILYLDGEVFGYQSKQTALDNTEGRGQDATADQDSLTMETEESRMFECGQQGCTKKFSSLSTYESHYHSCHHFVCATCRRVFVSSFMLDVHIQENHDSYFQILCSRIDMYQCLLESCGLKFRTPDLRRDHLVNVHKYPANFSFHKPITEKRSAIQQNGSGNGMECEIAGNAGETGKTGTPEAKPKKIPSSVCFGRGQQRSFQRRPRQKKRLNVEKAMDER